MYLKQDGKGLNKIVIMNTNELSPEGGNVHHSLMQSKMIPLKSLLLDRKIEIQVPQNISERLTKIYCELNKVLLI